MVREDGGSEFQGGFKVYIQSVGITYKLVEKPSC